ncbi:hypothetical protein DFAR_3990013 [Desulfarculales bacterium]
MDSTQIRRGGHGWLGNSLLRHFNNKLSGASSQYESLAGVELFWQKLSLNLQSGLRYRAYNSLKGNNYNNSFNEFAPTNIAQVNLYDI